MRETTKVIAFPVFFVGVGQSKLPLQGSKRILQNLLVNFMGDIVSCVYQGSEKQAEYSINNLNYVPLENTIEGFGLNSVTSTIVFGGKKGLVKYCNTASGNNKLVEIGQNNPRVKDCLTEFTNVHITFRALHPFNNSISTHNAWQENKNSRMRNHNWLIGYINFAQQASVYVSLTNEQPL
jgi:hypothetical protein